MCQSGHGTYGSRRSNKLENNILFLMTNKICITCKQQKKKKEGIGLSHLFMKRIGHKPCFFMVLLLLLHPCFVPRASRQEVHDGVKHSSLSTDMKSWEESFIHTVKQEKGYPSWCLKSLWLEESLRICSCELLLQWKEMAVDKLRSVVDAINDTIIPQYVQQPIICSSVFDKDHNMRPGYLTSKKSSSCDITNSEDVGCYLSCTWLLHIQLNQHIQASNEDKAPNPPAQGHVMQQSCIPDEGPTKI